MESLLTPLDHLMTDENRSYRARAREVAETAVRPVAAKYDQLQEYPWEVLAALKAADLTGVWVPKEYGGHGAGLLNLCIVVEELSRACGGVGVAYAVNALGSFPIILGGTEEQKRRWLPTIAKGEALVAFGLSERDAGSDAGSLQCSARRDGDAYVLNGHKKWNTNGGVATIYTIFCRTDPASKGPRGISAIVVEKPTPGFSIGKVEDKMGIRCVPVVELEFENCRVPVENLLGGEEGKGFRHAMATLDRARPGVAVPGRRSRPGGAGTGRARHRQSKAIRSVDPGLPGNPVDGGRHGNAGRGRASLVYTAARAVDTDSPEHHARSPRCARSSRPTRP